MSVTTPPRRDGVRSDAEAVKRDPEIAEFMLVVRRALLLVVRWIEAKYVV